MHSSLRLVPMALVMGTIFFLSHKPGDEFDIELFFGADKLIHMAIYAVLAATVILSFTPEARTQKPGRVALAGVVVAVVYGILDEFHQSFIPGRFPSAGDVVADFLGALVVCWFWYSLRGRRGRTD